MSRRLLLDASKLDITINRLCYQLLENHDGFNDAALVGLQPRGVFVARRIHERLSAILHRNDLVLGELDVTFYRDDFRRREIITPSATNMNFTVEGRKVILVDDVLYTGRTIRAGMDALLDFGRPASVELLSLVERRYSRQLPIKPDYVGITVDTITADKVKVHWKETEGEDGIWLMAATANDSTTETAA
jgi:pyrimidine operon attenuation protein/uracil phosphoribosyltransferase